MNSTLISLLLSIIVIVLCVEYSIEDEFGVWFNRFLKNKTNDYENSSAISSTTQPSVWDRISNTESEEYSYITRELTTTTTRRPTTTTTTTTTTTPEPLTTSRSQDVPISTPYNPWVTTQYPINTTSLPLRECLKVSMNAKVIFKYNSSDGFTQEVQFSAGIMNGEVIQTNKCDRKQSVFIKYDI